MRCGSKWSETVIVLVGALSRWVNTLDDSREPTKEEKGVLKSLRVNLKAGIDFGLETQQTTREYFSFEIERDASFSPSLPLSSDQSVSLFLSQSED